ncbi:hypothetical protein AB0D99_12850 [Streptomyces sp. NPDC047971]|uniref:hypothetical protein n=1 Tax=Streptomyces sp. NPDC047971 TaxID=3154499 RepID=UPI0033DBD338
MATSWRPWPSEAGEPAPAGSLAGRPAAEGRERPGRPVEPRESTAAPEPDGPARTKTATADEPPEAEGEADEGLEAVPETDSTADTPPPASAPAVAPRLDSRTTATSADRQIPVLTLGAGLAMMGLGIGFLGVRMRRR